MKKLLNKGKILISCISVLSILAVSVLSMFTATGVVPSAVEGAEALSYPINGKYDADVTIKEGGIEYSDIDYTIKKDISKFTAFDTKFWLTADGDGTANSPFIIKTANQFAAVATNNLVYDAGVETNLNIENYKFITVNTEKILDTSAIYFKVADNIKAFDMNNTNSYVDLSGNKTSQEVEAALKDGVEKTDEFGNKLVWQIKNSSAPFKGIFDGNGVVIYGLMSKNDGSSALFPQVSGVTIRNTTVKNSYFYGDVAAAFVGKNVSKSGVIIRSCAAYNNHIITTRLNSTSAYGYEGGGVAIANNTDGASFTMYDSLVYGNTSKHIETVKDIVYINGTIPHSKIYNINYGLFHKSSNVKGALISNSIVLDCAPYSMIYNSNGFNNSQYNTVYTNMIDVEIENTGYTNNGEKTFVEKTSFTDDETGRFTHNYNIFEDGNDKKVNYTRTFTTDNFIKVNPENAMGNDAKTAMPNLDWSKWTVNIDGLPTPKIYSVREYSAGSVWSGDVAVLYTSGEGTEASPYVVSTAEEFALMLTTAKSGENFVLGADIIINDTSAADWTQNAKQWFTSNDVAPFEGVLDGNGYTVSGLYYSGDQKGDAAGLIPVLGSKATVKNIKFKNSVLDGDSDASLGALAGFVADNCAQAVNVKNISVADSVEFNGDATVGGIIGKVGYSYLRISDSISKSNGLFSATAGQADVKRSISVGAYPFADATDVTATGVYTDTEGLVVDGVTVVANADMKGEAAKTSMPGLEIPTYWVTVENDYPVTTGFAVSNGVKGEVWSGAVASDFASGNGTEDSPYIIETAEQLALCVSNPKSACYKLGADIYLNDVNGKLWADKIGCVEWFNQYQANSSGTQNMTFDGDGYVIYGLYINNTNGDIYYRAGLFPQLTMGAVVKNVGITQAYLLGNTELTNEAIGAIAGTIGEWQRNSDVAKEVIKSIVGEEKFLSYEKFAYMPDKDANLTKQITSDPRFFALMPKIENCFVDHTCYITGYNAGGMLGVTGGAYNVKNCIVTATVEGSKYTGALVAQDYGYSSIFEDCLSLTQNCVKPAMGGNHSDWRSTPEYKCSEIIDCYYFAVSRMPDSNHIKISKPDERVGDAAQKYMTGLDWLGNDEDGTDETWTVVKDGTPMLSVFANNGRSQESFESFSDKGFAPPNVTVTFVTGADDVEVDPIVGRMYFKMHLPEPPARNGYKFTGWYVFDDLSLEYPYDYFPPRDLTLFAGWEPLGIIQDFESYTDTLWDYDPESWSLNKPGSKNGYQNKYVRTGSKSMHLLDTNTTASDCLLNYEDMLEPGKAYTITFWVTTDKADNPATLVSLVHNSKPDYLNSGVALEDMAVVTGLKVGEWTQYSYSFTAKTKWVSLRASGGSSLWFDDIIIAGIDGELGDGEVINLGYGTSPNTSDYVSVAVLVSAIMSCAIIAVVSRRNLNEIIED